MVYQSLFNRLRSGATPTPAEIALEREFVAGQKVFPLYPEPPKPDAPSEPIPAPGAPIDEPPSESGPSKPRIITIDVG